MCTIPGVAVVGVKMLKNIKVAPTTKSKAKKPEAFMLATQ